MHLVKVATKANDVLLYVVTTGDNLLLNKVITNLYLD